MGELDPILLCRLCDMPLTTQGQSAIRTKSFIYPFMIQPQSHLNARYFSTRSSQARGPFRRNIAVRRKRNPESAISQGYQSQYPPKLTHLDPSGSAHMVDISSKAPTTRKAVARAALHFSNPVAARLIAENGMKKGDVLGVARIAGIMASKKCSDLIPLCHPIMITKVSVECELVPPKNADKEVPSDAKVGKVRDSVVTKLIGPGHTLATNSDRSRLGDLLDNRERIRGRAAGVSRGRHCRKDRGVEDSSLEVGSDGVEWARSSALSSGVDGDIRDTLGGEASAEDGRENFDKVRSHGRNERHQKGEDMPHREAKIGKETIAEELAVDAGEGAAVRVGGHARISNRGSDWCGDAVDVAGSYFEDGVSDEAQDFGRVEITATVQCEGKTGVEMEALTAVTVAALTVYDMCKAVDKFMRIDNARVVRKEGGENGDWSSE